MSSDRNLDRILASLHEVALGHAPWSRPSLLIDETLRTHGNSMLFADGNSEPEIRIFFAWALYRGEPHPELERWYYENFYDIDERAPRVRRAPDGQLLHMRDVYTEEELKSSPAYHALRSRGHGGDGINVRLDGPHGSRITWLIHDPVNGAGWSSAQLDIIRALLPHIRQTVHVQQSLSGAQALAATMQDLLGVTALGILQLDARGRILAANERGLDVLRTGDAVFDEKGFLLARTPRGNDELQKLLGRALPAPGPPGRGGARKGGSILLKRARGLPPLMVHVNPSGNTEEHLGAWPVAALVLLVDPTQHVTVDPSVAAEALGLTPMESQVAILMAQDIAVPEIAARMDRRISTIRFHVKSMYRKVGLTRQHELTRLVQSVARKDTKDGS